MVTLQKGWDSIKKVNVIHVRHAIEPSRSEPEFKVTTGRPLSLRLQVAQTLPQRHYSTLQKKSLTEVSNKDYSYFG